MLKQKFKQINELDSLYSQVENLENKNLELTDELKEVKAELETVKNDFNKFKKESINFGHSFNDSDKTLKTQINELRNELAELKGNYSQLEKLFFDSTETLKNDIAELPVIVIGETAIGESVLSYHLRTSPQTQSKNHRYFYKSNYLFTAPLNLKNLLTIEFNRLMNSNLSFENVVEELKIYKESLALELRSNGIQTELEAVLND